MEDFQRLGVLGDWENSYKSMDPAYEADIVRALGRIVANGHLQRGKNQFIGAMTAVLHWLRQKSSIKIKFLNLFM